MVNKISINHDSFFFFKKMSSWNTLHLQITFIQYDAFLGSSQGYMTIVILLEKNKWPADVGYVYFSAMISTITSINLWTHKSTTYTLYGIGQITYISLIVMKILHLTDEQKRWGASTCLVDF